MCLTGIYRIVGAVNSRVVLAVLLPLVVVAVIVYVPSVTASVQLNSESETVIPSSSGLTLKTTDLSVASAGSTVTVNCLLPAVPDSPVTLAGVMLALVTGTSSPSSSEGSLGSFPYWNLNHFTDFVLLVSHRCESKFWSERSTIFK